LRNLADPEKFDDLRFWGRIIGEKSNYYFALALKFDSYEFPLKKFFFCTDNFEFKLLPPVIAQFKDRVEMVNNEFIGDPEHILWEDTSEPEVEPPKETEPVVATNDEDGDEKAPEDNIPIPESEDEDEQKEVILKKFTEADRLAYVIRAIEIECAVVPIGSLKLTPKHNLIYNKRFEGLDIQHALNLNNWMHHRQPLYQEKKKEMEKAEAIFKKDLLDDLEYDLPKGCWTVQSDLSQQLVTIRNLKWHGFIGYHRVKTHDFGYCYFGNGIKNVELSLLI